MQYTPYKLKSNATAEEIEQHAHDRAYYDMSGDKNYYKYMTTVKKQDGGKTFTYLDYMQKKESSRVFDMNGMISLKEVEEMKKRAQTGVKNIWHGYISVDEENSYKINTPEKCQRLIKATFPLFFHDMGLYYKDVDLMCALHTDRTHHLHIHFSFWEKCPSMKYREKELQYRHKGKIVQTIIDDVKERLMSALNNKELIDYRNKDELIRELKSMTRFRNIYADVDLKDKIVKLAKAIPKDENLFYGNKNAESYRRQIDQIVQYCLDKNKTAFEANERFYEKLSKIQYLPPQKDDNILLLKNRINPKTEELVKKVEWDYKCRVGNVILNVAKKIKPEIYERKPFKKYSSNNKKLKRNYAISAKKIGELFSSFIGSIGSDFTLFERDFSNRLQEIEEETERKRKDEERKVKNQSENYMY